MHLRNVFLLIFNLLSFNHFLTSSAEYVPDANILKASIINGASEFGRSVDFFPSLKLSYPLGACAVHEPSILALHDPSAVLMAILSFSTSGIVRYRLSRILLSGFEISRGCSTVFTVTPSLLSSLITVIESYWFLENLSHLLHNIRSTLPLFFLI